MKLIIFEDQKISFLFPFCENHASFEIKVGLYTNLERIVNLHNDNKGVVLIVRKEIEEITKKRFPDYVVNPEMLPEGKYFNGRSVCKDVKVGFQYIKNGMSLSDFYNKVSKIESKQDSKCPKINFLWDIFNYNDQFYLSDINIYKFNAISSFPSVSKLFETIKKRYDSAFLINEKNIIINEDSELKTGVIIDAEKSPVIIGKNVVVDIGALIQGPVFIDDNSYIAPGAKIRPGTFIGKNCKVGGEVSCSIFSNFSNKVHDGFLGHSFIGEWVNIGAGTNNSNLKNNYSSVKFNFHNKSAPTNTGKQFLGVFIGDYTRIGIATMFNAGTHIGLGSNVFGSGFQKKYISPFSWGENDKVDFDKFIVTCKSMKKRRNIKMSEADIRFLKKLYNKKI